MKQKIFKIIIISIILIHIFSINAKEPFSHPKDNGYYLNFELTVTSSSYVFII